METELKTLFETNDDLVIESLASICRSYQITEEDLFCKWESFSISHQLPSKITLNYVTLLRQEYSSQIHNKKSMDALLKRKSEDLVKRKQNDFQTPRKKKPLEMLSSPPFGGSAFSPGERAPRTPGTPSTQSKRFQDRLNKGKKEAVFNEHIPFRNDLNSVSVALIEGQQSVGYRYLYEKLTEKGDLLDERLNKFAKIVMESMLEKENEVSNVESDSLNEEYPVSKIDIGSFYTHPNTVVQEPRYYTGQICCDSVDGRLNIHSCVLETSRLIGNGTRVQLDFNQLLDKGETLHLYPGQCIAFKGINNTGNCISVQELISIPELTGNSVTGSDMKRIYEVLEELASVVESNSPDALVLMGPFVDSKHSMVQTVGLYATFKTQVADRLKRMKKANSNLQIVLIPSQDELVLEWLAFPQPPIGSAMSEQDKLRKLELLGLFDENGVLISNMFPNPCQFYINELVFACSALDVAFDMTSSDVFVGKDRGDKPDAIYNQIIQSRHFYPLFPPATEAKIDSARALSNEQNAPCALQCLPDFLILPSKLKQNIKTHGECICVNPEMSDDDVITSAVVDRSRVQIVRI
ncbi:DNA-directed DNA polymerase alpha subunit pol12 [Terramyces sp. JEL0728]|nr:DNA-directed DNA polymerase alpha subunit pol12 [Terramyces sp. JEL0728]